MNDTEAAIPWTAPQRLALAALITVVTIAAGIALPGQVFAWLVAAVVIIALGLLAGYWYEKAIELQSDLIPYQADNVELANDLQRTNARLAEVLDENVLLSDELDLPVPFVVVDQHPLPRPLRVVPTQRPAGGLS